jgi:hypothetical protein
VHENNNTDIDRHSLPPNHSATAPTTKPPAISTTSTSEYGPTFAIDNKSNSVSNHINL